MYQWPQKHVRQYWQFAPCGTDGYLRLLIWPNSLSSLSRDRAPGKKSKITAPVRPGEGPDVIWKPPFASVGPLGAYRYGVGPNSTTLTVTLTFTLTVRKLFTVVHHFSTSTDGQISSPFHQVISLRRWLKIWNMIKTCLWRLVHVNLRNAVTHYEKF